MTTPHTHNSDVVGHSASQQHPAPFSDGPVVIMLVGLIASGKSTFAQALENQLPHFRRCNQDELGSRLRVEVAVRQALTEGLSVCVDRTNVDPTQRAHWINIAREFPGTRVGIIVFDTPYNVCASRLHTRMFFQLLMYFNR